MIWGLIGKSVRESHLSTLLIGIGLMAIETLLAYLPPSFYKDFSEQWLQMPFVRNMLTAILGMEVAGTVGPWAIASIAWVHPLVIALLSAHAILYCTRVPVGEIDRGTIDVLLGLPISRTKLYLCESAIWLVWGIALALFTALGNAIGGWFNPPELRTSVRAMPVVMANWYCLYLAVGGLAWTTSALSDRRGRAIGAMFGIVVASFLLNYLAPFQKIVEKLSVVSILRYYRPVFILRDAAWPVSDLLVLAGVGATFWLLGWVLFVRRDICTV